MRYDDIAAAAHKGKAGKMTKRGLTPMRDRTTLLRAEHGLTVPFLRLAAAGRLKLNIAFVMDNRRTGRGYYTLSGSAGAVSKSEVIL